jgi:enterochelin esterase-like enzyme
VEFARRARWRLLTCLAVAAMAAAHAATVSAQEQRARLNGLVFDSSLDSPILGHEMPYRVYLPAEYFVSPNRRFPVLYMLHGAGGNFTEWADSFLPEQADEMMAQGRLQPMIVVMADGNGRTYFANWDGGPRYSDYVAQDVVGAIDARFHTIPSQHARAIGGLSMGGLAALQIAMRHPTTFGVVGAHSPSIRLEPDPELWFMTGPTWLEHDPLWLARNETGLDQITYWIDVGEDDWWRSNIEGLYAGLTSAGLGVSWHLFAGTHEAEYWIAHVPDYLRFYGDNLQAS